MVVWSGELLSKLTNEFRFGTFFGICQKESHTSYPSPHLRSFFLNLMKKKDIFPKKVAPNKKNDMRKKPSLFWIHPHFQEKKIENIFFSNSPRFEEVEEDFDEIKAVLDPEDSDSGRWVGIPTAVGFVGICWDLGTPSGPLAGWKM